MAAVRSRARSTYSGDIEVPFWAPGGRASLPTLRQNLGPVHLAGDYQLDMPSLADAAGSGQQAAEEVLASL